jgi:hypothetical protein
MDRNQHTERIGDREASPIIIDSSSEAEVSLSSYYINLCTNRDIIGKQPKYTLYASATPS